MFPVSFWFWTVFNMNKKLFVLICFLLVLETQSFPDKRAGGDKKRKRPSGTNFLKKVLENVIDRARKGLATPRDNEVLMYLSSVPFLKDRMCGKMSNVSEKQSKTTPPTTQTPESSALNADFDEDASMSFATKKKTQSDKLPEKTATKSSLRGEPSAEIPASNRLSNTLKASKPHLRHPSTAEMKQSSVVETDSMDTVVYIRRKRDLQDGDSKNSDENIVEMLDQHDSWHNEEPSEENQPKRFDSGNPLETRADNSLNDQELDAIIGEENPDSIFISKDFENGNQSESETTNSNTKSENINKSQETKDAFNANENNGNTQTNKNMGESVDEEANPRNP